MSTMQDRKLTQVYTTTKQKARFKEFVEANFQGDLQSMSKITWHLWEMLISLEEDLNFDQIYDGHTFKKEFLNTLCAKTKKKVLDFHV